MPTTNRLSTLCRGHRGKRKENKGQGLADKHSCKSIDEPSQGTDYGGEPCQGGLLYGPHPVLRREHADGRVRAGNRPA